MRKYLWWSVCLAAAMVIVGGAAMAQIRPLRGPADPTTAGPTRPPLITPLRPPPVSPIEP